MVSLQNGADVEEGASRSRARFQSTARGIRWCLILVSSQALIYVLHLRE